MPVLTTCISTTTLFIMLATSSGCRIYKKYRYGRVACYESARDFAPAPVSLSYPVPCRDLDWQQ